MHRACLLVVCAVLTLSHGTAGVEASSPYRDLDKRGVKALSDQKIADLLAGRGTGYALTAELNGYPGPAHVLELNHRLGLTPTQRNRAQSAFDAMQAEAKVVGAEIVAAERAFDRAFATARINKGEITRRSEALGRLHGRYRAVHLNAHLEMMAILSPHQIELYRRLRGYGGRVLASPPHRRKH